MARTTAEIQATMDAEQAAQPDLSTLNSTSQTAIYTLWKYIVAKCQNVLEQLWDKKQTELEAILVSAPVLSNEWAKVKSLEFQYDATVPQNMILVDFVPQYETVDITKRIITRAFVINNGVGALILVAKSEPPVKLAAGELSSFDDYFRKTGDGTDQAVGLGHIGQNIVVDSLDPDLLWLEAEITYRGQYTATIEDDCILAIETFISNVGTTPVLKVTDLITVLKTVEGFVDIYIENMATRAAAVAFGSRTYLITAYSQTLTEISITAGYMIGETTAANTLADKLTFTSV
jgi:hypothetical protein